MDSIIKAAKAIDIRHNVSIRVIDEATQQVVSQHSGHNAATNSLMMGIGHFLLGEGVLGQGSILRRWVPQYISLGTMGLHSQECDEEGLPSGIGPTGGSEEERFKQYLMTSPGFGSDGYDPNLMNNRKYAGLGPVFAERASSSSVDCELISDSYPRAKISYREIIPEYEAEYPETVDVVFSTMVSTGALAQFREPDKDYILISEVGLWSVPTWSNSGENGMLAGYRIAPPDEKSWDMTVPENREILKRNIIKVKKNQVVQVIWKIQLGGLAQFGGIDKYYPEESYLKWKIVL